MFRPSKRNEEKIMATFDSLIEGNLRRAGSATSIGDTRIIICYYRDEKTDEVHLFQSEDFWFDLSPIDQQQKFLVPVYVYNNDYSNYHVAVNEFIESTDGRIRALSYEHIGSVFIEEPLTQAMRFTKNYYSSFLLIGFVFTVFGVVFFLFENNIPSIIVAFLGLLLLIHGLKNFIKNKSAKPEKILAQLTNIDKGSQHWYCYKKKYLYVLIFEDEKGLYYYPTNNISDFEVKKTYNVIVKNNAVIEIAGSFQ